MVASRVCPKAHRVAQRAPTGSSRFETRDGVGRGPTVTGLAAHATYYFAVSAFNGLESPCSAELKAVIDSI